MLFDWLCCMWLNVGIVVLVVNENLLIFCLILGIGCVSVVSKFDEVGYIVMVIYLSYSGGVYLLLFVWCVVDVFGICGDLFVKLLVCEIEVI